MAHSGFDEQVAICKENTIGTFQSGGTFDTLPYNSCTIKTTRETLESNRLGVANRFGTRLGAYNVAGDLGNELVYGAYDELIAAAIGGEWNNDEVKSGKARAGFSVIRKRGSLGVQKFAGVEVNTMQLEIGQNSAISLSFGLVGVKELEDRVIGAATLSPMTEDYPLTGYDVKVKDGNTVVAFATGFSLNTNRNIQTSFNLGSYTTGEKVVGKTLIDGSVTLQMLDFSYQNDFQSETRKDLLLEFTDPFTGNVLELDLPNVLLTGVTDDTSGDGEVPVVCNFYAEYDSQDETACTFRRVPNN